MKSNTVPQTIAAGQVPPYCYRLPCMSTEAGAMAAIKALNISHPCDALALLWELRREAAKAQMDSARTGCLSSIEMADQTNTTKAASLLIQEGN